MFPTELIPYVKTKDEPFCDPKSEPSNTVKLVYYGIETSSQSSGGERMYVEKLKVPLTEQESNVLTEISRLDFRSLAQVMR